MSEWRPISTAPHNGTEVLVLSGTRGRPIVRVGRTHEAAYGGQGWVTVPGEWHMAPTHWMPLPAAPSDYPAAAQQNAPAATGR